MAKNECVNEAASKHLWALSNILQSCHPRQSCGLGAISNLFYSSQIETAQCVNAVVLANYDNKEKMALLTTDFELVSKDNTNYDNKEKMTLLTTDS